MKAAHSTDLLPAYLNGTLDPELAKEVREHLQNCAGCRAELASWEAVSDAAVVRSEALPAPSAGVMEGVWAKVEREPAPLTGPSSISKLSLAWQLLVGQIPLVRNKIWAASAVTMALGLAVSLLLSTGASAAGATFALFAPVIAAVGVAFVYGPENDPSLEVALSTPTPARLVLLARLTLVYGYDLALALAATAVLAAVNGTLNLWPLVSLWIGPMLFFSALALLLSLLFGSSAAVLTAMALWGVRLAAATYSTPGLDKSAWAETVETLWRANAMLLLLAALLLAVALLLAPYRSVLTRSRTI